MTAYYPSQASHHQPAYTSSSHGHGHGYYPSQHAPSGDYYGQPSNVVYVPSHSHSHSSRRSRSRRHHHSPQVVSGVPMQPSSYSSRHSGGHRHHLSFGERVRRFFGLAPRGPFKYKSNKGSWGFLGYSRRPRYTDAMTGGEVDRKGRPIYRV